MARGVIFVDVLDGEDGVVRVQRAGFFDTRRVKGSAPILRRARKTYHSPGIRALADRFGDDAKRHVVRKRGQLRMLHRGLGEGTNEWTREVSDERNDYEESCITM
jgi:hypothetical protein